MAEAQWVDPRLEVMEMRQEKTRFYTKQGWSLAEIAEEIGVSTRTVRRYRNEMGISETPAPPITYLQEGIMKVLAEDGASVKEIARSAGVSKGAVLRRFPDAAWTHAEVVEYAYLVTRYPLDKPSKYGL